MTTSYSKRIPENSEELIAQAHYVVAKSQVDGNLTFDGHDKSVEELDNESRCRNLCTRIERVLQTCCEEEIPELLEMYDLLYRIGYGKMPDQRFMSAQRQRVYTAWRSGNRNIQESQIYRLLKKCINGHVLCTHMLKNWLSTLSEYNCFPNVTTHENYQRLSLIMRENIDVLIKDKNIMSEISYGKTAKELKREWYRANKVADLTTLTTPLLKSYLTFTNSLFPAILDYEAQQEYDSFLLDVLLTRHELNPYERKAFEITLTQTQAVV